MSCLTQAFKNKNFQIEKFHWVLSRQGLKKFLLCTSSWNLKKPKRNRIVNEETTSIHRSGHQNDSGRVRMQSYILKVMKENFQL